MGNAGGREKAMTSGIPKSVAPGTTCFATIVSANYLAYARVLADSLARFAPDAAFRVLIVDRKTDAVQSAVVGAELSATYAAELPIDGFERVAYKYDIVELNTALKATFLKSLLAEGFERVVYVDPDIRFFAPPVPILDALVDHDIVVTPHSLAPVMDGLRPSDIDFLRNGTFNLGFIGVRASDTARRMLDWWESRSLSLGFNDPGFGTFVDQKWVDLLPSYFASLSILRHKGCNVAYWNLHERAVANVAGQYEVDGDPLVFFHFSGVKADAPTVLSKHQTRHSIAAGSALSELVHDYCAALLAAGHRQLSALPYTFGSLSDGTPVTGTMRRALCCEGVDETNPFDAGSAFQRGLRSTGVTPTQSHTARAAGVSTLNFDPNDRRVRVVNAAVRLMARVMGVERVRQLLAYAAFLSRQSNYASVLLSRSFQLDHTERR